MSTKRGKGKTGQEYTKDDNILIVNVVWGRFAVAKPWLFLAHALGRKNPADIQHQYQRIMYNASEYENQKEYDYLKPLNSTLLTHLNKPARKYIVAQTLMTEPKASPEQLAKRMGADLSGIKAFIATINSRQRRVSLFD